MKIIVLFGVAVCVLQCVILQVNSENDDILDEDEQACVVQTEISVEVVVEAKKTSTVPAQDQKYKDFLSCCWKRFGYQREDGEIEWDKIREVLRKAYKPAVAVSLVEKCDNIHGKTDGDTVALVLLCLDEYAPSLPSVHGYYTG